MMGCMQNKIIQAKTITILSVGVSVGSVWRDKRFICVFCLSISEIVQVLNLCKRSARHCKWIHNSFCNVYSDQHAPKSWAPPWATFHPPVTSSTTPASLADVKRRIQHALLYYCTTPA